MNTAGQQLCTCPCCHGTGRVAGFSRQLMQTPTAATPSSTAVTTTCGSCGGTGRMWVSGWWAK